MLQRHLARPRWLHEQPGAVVIDVEVALRGRRPRVMGDREGRLKIQLPTSPDAAAANVVLVHFLARVLGCARAQIDVVGGATNKRKTVRLALIPLEKIVLTLAPASV